MLKFIKPVLFAALTLPASAVAQNYSSGSSVTIYSLDGPPVPIEYNAIAPRPAPTAQDVGAANTATAATETVDIDVPKTPSGIEWSGRANLGLSLQTGNNEQDAVNADTTLKAKWGEDKHRATLKAEYNRETQNSNTVEDNRVLQAMYDYFFTEKWFLNSIASYEQDSIENIDMRTNIGFGIGHQAFEQDDLNLQYVLGPTYLREELDNGDVEDSLTARWALDYDQRFWDDIFQLFHEHEFLLPTDDTEAFLFYSKSGIRIPIQKGLVASFEVDFEWDNAPAAGVVEDDVMYAFKLGYEW